MSAATPYRANPDEPPAPPRELVCPWRDAENRPGAVQLFWGVSAGVGVAGMLGSVHPALGLGGLAAIATWAVWRVRASRRAPPGVVLRVEGGALVVPQRGELPALRVPLDDVIDVEVTRKSIQRVTLEQPVGAPMLSANVGPEVDVARITFVYDDGEADRRAHLTDAYASYSHCIEWLGKVRVFLRAHGWKPDAERV